MPDFYPQAGLSFRNNREKVKRRRQIISVFMKFGLDYLFDVSRINFIRNIQSRRKGYEKLSNPEKLRMAFEELGPTFIKFGQILSTRPDFVPPAYICELEKHQDKVLPVESHQMQQCVEKELNKPINELFKEFEEQPVASASLNQVHRAVLHNGEIVALKIQNPASNISLNWIFPYWKILPIYWKNDSEVPSKPKSCCWRNKKSAQKRIGLRERSSNFR